MVWGLDCRVDGSLWIPFAARYASIRYTLWGCALSSLSTRMSFGSGCLRAMWIHSCSSTFAPAWSDLIHVTLWRMMDFGIYSVISQKVIHLLQNFVRTKCILRKIFFRISILWSHKTLWMLYNLRWKNCKNHLREDMIVLRGRRCLATKINITVFVWNEVLKIFHLTIFSKKKQCFRKRNQYFPK